jgi:hypothetical protein
VKATSQDEQPPTLVTSLGTRRRSCAAWGATLEFLELVTSRGLGAQQAGGAPSVFAKFLGQGADQFACCSAQTLVLAVGVGLAEPSLLTSRLT